MAQFPSVVNTRLWDQCRMKTRTLHPHKHNIDAHQGQPQKVSTPFEHDQYNNYECYITVCIKHQLVTILRHFNHTWQQHVYMCTYNETFYNHMIHSPWRSLPLFHLVHSSRRNILQANNDHDGQCAIYGTIAYPGTGNHVKIVRRRGVACVVV